MHFIVDRALSRYFLHQLEINRPPIGASTPDHRVGVTKDASKTHLQWPTPLPRSHCFWAPRRMILIGPGPMPFDANIRSVATLTVACGANRRTKVERFGTELAALASERLADARHRDLDDLEYR